MPVSSQCHVEYNERMSPSSGDVLVIIHTCRPKAWALGLDLGHKCQWPTFIKEKYKFREYTD